MRCGCSGHTLVGIGLRIVCRVCRVCISSKCCTGLAFVLQSQWFSYALTLLRRLIVWSPVARRRKGLEAEPHRELGVDRLKGRARLRHTQSAGLLSVCSSSSYLRCVSRVATRGQQTHHDYSQPVTRTHSHNRYRECLTRTSRPGHAVCLSRPAGEGRPRPEAGHSTPPRPTCTRSRL